MTTLHPIFQQALAPFIHADFLESSDEAMACIQIEHDKAVKSDELYDLSMVLTDMGFVDVDAFIRRQCEANQIDFPPKQIKANQRPVIAEIF